MKSLFNWQPSHIEQGFLEKKVPLLLKDLAAEDPSIKAWPQDLIAYIAIYLERKCARNASPDDILLAGLLLRFMDSDDGMRLQPFESAALADRVRHLKVRIRAFKNDIERKTAQGFIIDDEMLQQQKALEDECRPLDQELTRKLNNASFEEAKLKLAKLIGESRYSYLELFTTRYTYPYAKPPLEILQKNILFILVQYMYYAKCVLKSEEKQPFKMRFVSVTKSEPEPKVEIIMAVRIHMEAPESKNVSIVEYDRTFPIVKDDGSTAEFKVVKGDVITDEIKIVKDCRDKDYLAAMRGKSIIQRNAFSTCAERFKKELNTTISRLTDPGSDEYTQIKIRFILAFHALNILTVDATKNLLPVLIKYANKIFELQPTAVPQDPLLDELLVFFANTFVKLKAMKPSADDDETAKEGKNYSAFKAYRKSKLIIDYIAEHADPRAKQRICEFLDSEITANNELYAECVQELLQDNGLLSRAGHKSARMTMSI